MSDNTPNEPTPIHMQVHMQANFSTTRHDNYGPDDGSHEHERVRREKLRREREWLLADMDPSPLIEQRRREREMNAQWDANREAMDRAADRLTGQAIPEWLRSRPMDIPVTDTPVFTEPGPGAAQLTDGTPEQLAAWIEKRQARLIELTGFDLRVPPEGDEKPGPVSGEETTA